MSPHAAGARALYELGREDGAPGLPLLALATAGAVALGIKAWEWWQARQQAQAALSATDSVSDALPDGYGRQAQYGSLEDLLRGDRW